MKKKKKSTRFWQKNKVCCLKMDWVTNKECLECFKDNQRQYYDWHECREDYIRSYQWARLNNLWNTVI